MPGPSPATGWPGLRLPPAKRTAHSARTGDPSERSLANCRDPGSPTTHCAPRLTERDITQASGGGGGGGRHRFFTVLLPEKSLLPALSGRSVSPHFPAGPPFDSPAALSFSAIQSFGQCSLPGAAARATDTVVLSSFIYPDNLASQILSVDHNYNFISVDISNHSKTAQDLVAVFYFFRLDYYSRQQQDLELDAQLHSVVSPN